MTVAAAYGQHRRAPDQRDPTKLSTESIMTNQVPMTLHDIVRYGNEYQIQRCLAHCDVNARNEHDETALVCADFSNPRIIKILVEAGADLNVRDRYSRSPLHLAVAEENALIVDWLTRSGVNLDVTDSFGKTPLHLAVEYGLMNIIRLLIWRGAKVTDFKYGPLTIYDCENQELCSFLQYHNAAYQFSQERSESTLARTALMSNVKFRWLLDQWGSNMNVLDNDGFAALHFASFRGSVRFVRFALDRGADVSIRAARSFEQTPLHLACLGTSPDNCEIVQLLLERGADINAEDSHGHTPLHLVVSHGKARNTAAVIGVLVANGADLMARDADGSTPLHLAVYDVERNYEVIECLLRLGAKMHASDTKGETPYKYALKYLELTIVRFFVERVEQIVRMRTKHGETALHFAAGNPNIDVIAYLVDRGVDLDVVDKRGFTALNYALECCNRMGAEYLIDRGARLNPCEKDEVAPLLVAIEIKDKAALRILLDHGADVNQRSSEKEDSLLKVGLNAATPEIQLILIEHVAVMSYQDQPVAEDAELLMMSDERMSDQHEECLYELRRLELRKFHGDVSYYELMARKHRLAEYARDEDLVDSFNREAQHENLSLYPRYYFNLATNFTMEIMKQRFVAAAANFLGDYFRNSLPRIMVETILDYVGDRELMRIGQMVEAHEWY